MSLRLYRNTGTAVTFRQPRLFHLPLSQANANPLTRNLAEDVCFNNSVFRFIQTMEGIIRVSRREERLFMMSVNTLFLVPLRHVTHATDNKELN